MKLGFHGFLILVILLATPLAAYFTVFKPMNVRIETERKEAEHKEALLSKLREETARNTDLEMANQALQRNVHLIEARLPSEKEVDEIVRQVSDLAVQAGLSPPAIKSSKPFPAALYKEQPLEMEVSGNFVPFFTFLAKVEKLPRITRVHDLKITGQMKEEAEIKAEFTLSIYFQDDQKLAGAEGTK